MLQKLGKKLNLSVRKKNKNGDLNLEEWFKPTITPNLSTKSFSNIKENPQNVNNIEEKTSTNIRYINKHKDINDNISNQSIKSDRIKRHTKIILNVIPVKQNSIEEKENNTKKHLVINNSNKTQNQINICFSSRNYKKSTLNNNSFSSLNRSKGKTQQSNIIIYHNLRAVSCFSKFQPLKQYTKRRNVIRDKISFYHSASFKKLENKTTNKNDIDITIKKLSPMNVTYKTNTYRNKNKFSSIKNNSFMNKSLNSSLLLKDLYQKEKLLNCSDHSCNSFNKNLNDSQRFVGMSNINFCNELSSRHKQKIKLKTVLYREFQ